jgi:hypothetical protein
MLKMTVRGLTKLAKDLGIEDKKDIKALETAIKVEGFKRLRQLRDDVRHGRPGGHEYAAELSKIAGRTKTGRLRKNQAPLYRIARMLRYDVSYSRDLSGRGGIQFSFGFLTHGRRPIPSTYKKMLIKHEEGLDVLYRGSRTELGKRFARIGGKLKKKGDPDAKYFFLRKTTGRKIDLPSRRITEPYWDANRAEAMANIRRNYRLKRQGKRI